MDPDEEERVFSYWRWPQRNLAGNAIDFHMQVLGMSFHDAMRHITVT
jgi:hypothetical protein